MYGKTFSALLVGAIALAGCTTTGSGTGSVEPGGAPVNFSWKSTNGGTTGTMSATLDDGKLFSGPYLEVTRQARNEDFDPMWSGWQVGWNDWGAWEPFPAAGYTTLYSGRVVANLQPAGRGHGRRRPGPMPTRQRPLGRRSLPGELRASLMAMKSVLDRSFRYVPSVHTDLRKTFARIRRERQRAQARSAPVVLSIKQRKP
jgi:hypothetical protein